tara:strand:+ start:1273 stop:1857 length:585 start_codon:yes stop_codon:yes gene_type:complete
MKVYLDDERQTPPGFIRAYWPEEAIAMLKTGKVDEISLDHDLGDDEHGTGYDVVKWIEEEVFLNGFVPPEMNVHSANSSAAAKMWAGIESIERFHERNLRKTEGRTMKITKRKLRKLIREQAMGGQGDAANVLRRGMHGGGSYLDAAVNAIAGAFMFDDFDPGEEQMLKELIIDAANKWYQAHNTKRDEYWANK